MNDLNYSSIVTDSRKANKDSCFFCIRGALADGHEYAKSAYENGARVFFVEEKLDLPSDAVQIVVDDTRKALCEKSREFYGKPDEKLCLIGITGTKGKTTCANMIYSLLTKAGRKCGVIGTNGVRYADKYETTANTTPDSLELYRIFNDMANAGCEYCVMEVSSQAYKTDRVYGLEFDIGVFTNLSPDHIGEFEHKDFEEYKMCKAQLFSHSMMSLINIDSEYSDTMAKAAKGEVFTFSVKDIGADVYADNIKSWKSDSALGVDFDARVFCEDVSLRIKTPGIYSVENALAVVGVARMLDVPMENIVTVLPDLKVKGRFEIVDALPYATFVIDYAHNELSLESVLKTIKEYNPKRVICLFGSVGDRTQLRRGKMGQVAKKYCDFCILTSDNPGNEEPEIIIYDIEKGLGDCPHINIPDREEAIKLAVNLARAGDIILFAGKGHEDYQLIKNEKIPFCESDIIKKAASALLMNV